MKSNFKMDRKQIFQRLGTLAALIILILVFSIISPDFRTGNNFISLLRQSSINGLIAFGMTGVILTGSIDLSVGSVLGLSAMLCASMIRAGVPAGFALLIALALGLGMGAVSGLLVTKGRLQPFIATLVTMQIFRGLTLIYSGGKPISNIGGSAIIKGIRVGSFLKIPAPVWILLIVFAIYFFVLNNTTFGRKVYAVGSNQDAAELTGVNSSKVKIIIYAVSGLLSALAGIILLSRLGSAQPTLGEGYEMDAIAATVLGGTSMNGGRGKLYGTLIGVLIIAVLSNGLNILGVSSYSQDVVKGVVILLAVWFERDSK